MIYGNYLVLNKYYYYFFFGFDIFFVVIDKFEGIIVVFFFFLFNGDFFFKLDRWEFFVCIWLKLVNNFINNYSLELKKNVYYFCLDWFLVWLKKYLNLYDYLIFIVVLI